MNNNVTVTAVSNQLDEMIPLEALVRIVQESTYGVGV